MKIKRKESLKYRLLQFLIWFLNEGLDWFDILSSKHYYLKSGRSYNERSFEVIIRNLEKVGYIEKRVDKRGVFLRLTSAGEQRLIKEIPLPFLAKKRWDGIFRGVAFDIPEERRVLRNATREKLRSLGFGMLQRSFWITPYPLTEELDEFIESRGLSRYAMVVKTKRLEIERAKRLAKKVWKLGKIAKIYKEFIKKWQERLEKEKDLSKFIGEWRGEFFELLKIDPYLPKKLLPEHWPERQAKKTFICLEKRVKRRF